MIHATIIDTIPEDSRGEITHALMGTTPAPQLPAAMVGARLPPVGVPVRTLPKGNLRQSMGELTAALPKGQR